MLGSNPELLRLWHWQSNALSIRLDDLDPIHLLQLLAIKYSSSSELFISPRAGLQSLNDFTGKYKTTEKKAHVKLDVKQ
jgi:hypothetical protein